MATASESSIQFERDLRSNQKDAKRAKDHNKKWALKPYYEHRPLAGVRYDWSTDISTFEKVRPAKIGGHDPWVRREREPKMRVTTLAKADIKEASGAVSDLFASPRGRSSETQSEVLYSYDAVASPAPKLSLEVFVKPNTKETEKLVTKEYEVLDMDGDVVKGKKARRNLRKAASTSPEGKVEDKLTEVDGFELI